MDCRLLESVRKDYRKVTKELIRQKRTVSVMESCTSGLVASFITDTPGASDVFQGSAVTYSNETKLKFGVSGETIGIYGVYSPETVHAMAAAVKMSFSADIGIGISGSLCTVDEKNADSIPGVVWYSVLFPEHERIEKIEVPIGLDRFESKVFVSGAIAQTLLDLLRTNRDAEAVPGMEGET